MGDILGPSFGDSMGPVASGPGGLGRWWLICKTRPEAEAGAEADAFHPPCPHLPLRQPHATEAPLAHPLIASTTWPKSEILHQYSPCRSTAKKLSGLMSAWMRPRLVCRCSTPASSWRRMDRTSGGPKGDGAAVVRHLWCVRMMLYMSRPHASKTKTV